MFLRKKKKRESLNFLRLLGLQDSEKRSNKDNQVKKQYLLLYVVIFCVLSTFFPAIRLRLQSTGKVVSDVVFEKKEHQCENGRPISLFLHKIEFQNVNKEENFLKCVNHNSLCREVDVSRASCFNSNQDTTDIPKWNCEFEYDKSLSFFVEIASQSQSIECAHSKDYKTNPKGKYGCTPCFLYYHIRPLPRASIFLEYLSYFFDFGDIFKVLTSFVVLLIYLIISLLSCCCISTISSYAGSPSSSKIRNSEHKKYYFNKQRPSRRRKPIDRKKKDFEREVNISNRLYKFMRDFVLPNTVVDKTKSHSKRGMEPLELVYESDSDSSQSVSSFSSSEDTDFDSEAS